MTGLDRSPLLWCIQAPSQPASRSRLLDSVCNILRPACWSSVVDHSSPLIVSRRTNLTKRVTSRAGRGKKSSPVRRHLHASALAPRLVADGVALRVSKLRYARDAHFVGLLDPSGESYEKYAMAPIRAMKSCFRSATQSAQKAVHSDRCSPEPLSDPC